MMNIITHFGELLGGHRAFQWKKRTIKVGKPTHNVQKPSTLTKGNEN